MRFSQSKQLKQIDYTLQFVSLVTNSNIKTEQSMIFESQD